MARPKVLQGDVERLNMVITTAETAAIEKWRYAQRIPSKSEAIRRLCQIALLVERELEGVVDHATEGVRYLNDGLMDAIETSRAINAPGVEQHTFSIYDVREILREYTEHAGNALDAMISVQEMITTLYNAIAPLAEAPSVLDGTSGSDAVIAEAAQAMDEIVAKQKERAENRYIALLHRIETPEDRAAYEALSDEEQDAALEAKIAAMAAEEASDPKGFFDKYDLWPFWERPEWATAFRAPDEPQGGTATDGHTGEPTTKKDGNDAR